MGFFTLLFVTLVVALTINVYAPGKRFERAMWATFGFGWLTGELAAHVAIVIALITTLMAVTGAFTGLFGFIGLAAVLGSCAALLRFHMEGLGLGAWVQSRLEEGLGRDFRSRLLTRDQTALPVKPDRDALVRPFKRSWLGIERIKDIPIDHQGLGLDIYRPDHGASAAPVLMHIHGGAWKFGDKYGQALPLMQALTRLGWICVSVSYRLSPKATFPDHIIDCKAALAWIKNNIHDYGGDSEFIAVTGGSAGGHLTGLVALSANDPLFQPGFENQDTTVQAAAPFYGPFDWTDRDGLQPNQGLRHLLEREVIKTKLNHDPAMFVAGSPILRDLSQAPPMMLIHGSEDSLVPVGISRKMTEALRAESAAPVVYLEIPGAQHAFDIFASPRSEHAKLGVMQFLCYCYAEHQRSKG